MYSPEYETWQEVEGQLDYKFCHEVAQRVIRLIGSLSVNN